MYALVETSSLNRLCRPSLLVNLTLAERSVVRRSRFQHDTAAFETST